MIPRSLVAHLDADCFYVSAERVRHPDLLGKPVGVLGNQGACVIAKSYEMKAAGVKTGEPIWDARVKCPEGIYIKRDFRWYEVISRQMLDVTRKHSHLVEYYSIDEFFFAVETPRGQAVEPAIRAVQAEIKEKIRVPVTIGVARTRTLAKLFSDTAKPFGIRVASTREEERERLSQLSVQEISGIAGRRAQRLADRGIHTCLQLADADRRVVRELLTKTGEDLWWELNGTPATPIRPNRTPRQFISRGGSIGGASGDPNVIEAWLVRNAERLVEELEFYEVKAGNLTLALHFNNHPSIGANAPLASHTDRFDVLLDGLRIALPRCWRPGLVVTHMHLIAGKLRKPGFTQPGLFDPPAEPSDTIARLKREASERHGRFSVRSGTTLFLPELYRDPSHGFDICDVRGKFCF
ncbi:MAG: nucleotidyltransferase [Gemmataceae bacterium]|nr:nucleotidyltransferase [Gemmataceae bacterium]